MKKPKRLFTKLRETVPVMLGFVRTLKNKIGQFFTKWEYSKIIQFAGKPKGFSDPVLILRGKQIAYDIPLTMRKLLVIAERRLQRILNRLNNAAVA